MIDFMVIGLPRSGTAWLANLLTTDTSICLHEAFIDKTLEQLDVVGYFGKLGISETSAIFHTEKINAHPAKKLIVERNVLPINHSLVRIGLPMIPNTFVQLLEQIDGYRIKYQDIFNYEIMSKAYEYLLDKKLSYERHRLLVNLNVQNQTAIRVVKGML